MNKWGKIAWMLCGLFLMVLIASRFVIGGWVSYLSVPAGLFVISLMAALLIDLKYYISFFSMKTTKDGLNMGFLILIALVLLISVNYVSLKRNTIFDVTKNRVHTLSDQTQIILESLKSPMNVVYFYKGVKDQATKSRINALLGQYKNLTDKISVSNIDAYVHRAKADEYLKGFTESHQVMLFVEHNGKRIRVESPISESTLTSAMIKASRSGGVKKIAFLQGHGEKDLLMDEDAGLSSLKQSLESSAFELSRFNWIEGNETPDVDILAIVGPLSEILEEEQKNILSFLKKGGSLFLAIDPGESHNMGKFIRKFGVEFNNDYILNDQSRLIGRGMTGAFGILFNEESPITKKFKGNFVLFDVASSLSLVKSAHKKKLTEFLKSSPDSFAVTGLSDINPTKKQHYTMGVSFKGLLDENSKESSIVIFGDSDFLSNKDIIQGLNMDLAVNSMAYLAQEEDLVNIKPKSLDATRLFMTTFEQNSVVVICIFIPLLFFILGAISWYRRKNS